MAPRPTSPKASAAQPREVILKLLLAAEGGSLTTREAVSGCALLGISENHARVALVRLASAGMIEASARGAYQLGPEAAGLAAEVAKWREGEARVRPWTGQWIVVHTSSLGRRDRVALRSRDRALDLLGLRELDRGLFVRPDNLADGVAGARERLQTLGLDAEAAVFVATGFDEDREFRARRLWNGKVLTRAYEQTRRQLEAWMERVDDLDLETAARESYLIGDKAIRQLVFDPLLPDPLVDTSARAAFTDAVLRVDQVGHAIWQRRAAMPPTDRATPAVTRRAH
ncbi:MAG: PaaX family transcriptional regulator C-terminal domain-containing protein [Panacagrimonas sp.]